MPKRNSEERRRPRQQRAQVTVDAIVEAAEQVVEREGADRATTNRIAERAGVSIGSLYQYFPNKHALVETLRERERVAFDARVAGQVEAIGSLPLRAAIDAFVALLIGLHRERTGLHNALAPEAEAFHAEIDSRWMPEIAAFLESRRSELRPADLDLAARIVFDAIESATHGVALRSPALLDDPRYAAELADLLYRYLALDPS